MTLLLPATVPPPPFFAKEAKARLVKSGEETGRGNKKVVGQCPTTFLKSRDRAAAAVGLNGKTVSAAKAISLVENVPQVSRKEQSRDRAAAKTVKTGGKCPTSF